MPKLDREKGGVGKVFPAPPFFVPKITSNPKHYIQEVSLDNQSVGQGV